ncbi:flocculation protein FLO11 [Drosophila busckii]|uniref:flocculation protein FLO11 n=1 Tax=Drosophila busckii TaxID=30019 RepID=UPI001432A33C|nr:flocculation protein FLO11 [Drosophila busckii]
MPIIADATNDEPPAKCCKYCEESTHSVDGGPASWRLTLDQDLIDTLKGNFPSWFQGTSSVTTAAAAATATNKPQTQQHQHRQQKQLVASSIIPITIDTRSNNNNASNNNSSSSSSSNNTLQQQQHQQQQQQQQQAGILSSCSSSASPASSISSNCSKKSNSSSSVSSCSSSSSNSCSRSKSVSTATAQRLLNKSTATATATASPHKSLSRTLKATQRAHNSSPKVGHLVKSASLHSLSSGSSSSSSSSNSNSVCTSNGGSGSALLATISTSPLTTVEVFSSASCNGLLATRLSGKALEHTFQDIILLHEAYDEMSEGEQRLHATFLSSSDDGNNSDCYEARQSPPKAIVDSSPLQPAMDKNKESLKVKLMVRRPHSQLVEQGIIPYIDELDILLLYRSTSDTLRLASKATFSNRFRAYTCVTTAATPATITLPAALPNTISITSSTGAAPVSFGDATMLTAPLAGTPTPPTLSLIATTQPTVATVAAVQQQQQHPPPLPSPALSISSSIPPSPATSFAESTSSFITDLTRLEKMKVSDLKQHLKRRNLPVSGPKPQLIERLKPYLPLEPLECCTPANTPASATEVITISDAMDTSNSEPQQPPPVAMLVTESPIPGALEHEQMDVVQQLDNSHAMTLQTILPPQPQTATIIQNEELLRRQQRKIDELQRQLQRSQQELQQIRRQQQQQTVTAQVVNGLPSQQITLITTTTTANGPQQTLTMLPQLEKSIPAKVTVKPAPAAAAAAKLNGQQAKKPTSICNSSSSSSTGSSNQPTTAPINQKLVVKQQLEAKIQKQKAAAAAAAALQQQQQAQQQQQQQQQHQQHHMRLQTQKTQTVLIPSNNNNNNNTNATKLPVSPAKHSNVAIASAAAAGNTTTILHANKPVTAATTSLPHSNNVGLVWNEGNQTIFLLGLNDQQMTAHTLGNISLTATTTTAATGAAATTMSAQSTPASKKLLNGHQRTNSLPSIGFPFETKPIITQQQLQHLQLQQQQQQQQFQPTQQTIQLDIKTSTVPPPQYEEATKQLAANKAAAALGNNVPLMKIKEEPSTSPAPPAATLRKPTGIKSEQVSDVLDILIKQGELPESAALEPITPLTPLPELSLFNGVTPTTAAGGASIVPLVPKLEAPATPQSLPNLEMAMDTNDSHVNFASNQPAGYIENINMASPLQPDVGSIDAESVAKTLDIFLEQHHATPPPSTPPKCNSSSNGGISGVGVGVGVGVGNVDKPNSPDAKLNHFDEYELLELMSQQLEMDIGDDSNNYCSGKSNSSNNNLNLNRSLQPSINELLDASSPQSVLLNNNHSADVDFDADSFVAQLSQHVAGGSNHSGSNSSGANGNSNCNNILISTNGCGMGVDCSTSNGHYSGTPMEVCDDLESTFNSIMQAVNQQPSSSIHGDYASTAAGSNSSNSAMDSGGAVDAFNASGDIFDLFNIDDYKMSWAAGDFTV